MKGNHSQGLAKSQSTLLLPGSWTNALTPPPCSPARSAHSLFGSHNDSFVSPAQCDLGACTHPAKVRACSKGSCDLPLSLSNDKGMQGTAGGVSSATTTVLYRKTKSLAYFNFVSSKQHITGDPCHTALPIAPFLVPSYQIQNHRSVWERGSEGLQWTSSSGARGRPPQCDYKHVGWPHSANEATVGNPTCSPHGYS